MYIALTCIKDSKRCQELNHPLCLSTTARMQSIHVIKIHGILRYITSYLHLQVPSQLCLASILTACKSPTKWCSLGIVYWTRWLIMKGTSAGLFHIACGKSLTNTCWPVDANEMDSATISYPCLRRLLTAKRSTWYVLGSHSICETCGMCFRSLSWWNTLCTRHTLPSSSWMGGSRVEAPEMCNTFLILVRLAFHIGTQVRK